MSYVLYYSPGAASLCVHWMLLEIGAPFELRKLDFEKGEQRAPDYLKLNPNGVVPTLVVDGAPHAETAALLMLLAERHPEKGFAPAIGDPLRGEYLQWMLYLANTLMPAFRAWFYPHEPAGEANAAQVKDSARVRIDAVFDRAEAKLADDRAFLLGDRIFAADFLLTMLIRWSRNMPRKAEIGRARLADYAARMRQRPALIAAHEREALTDWIR